MPALTGVITAAGRGVRAYPYTETVPKCMLEVDGVPLVRRNVELMRDELGIRDIRIVVGHHGDVVQRYLGDGARLGVRITYALNDRLDLELPYSVHLGTRGLTGPCCLILGDECYVGTNHRELREFAASPALAVCAFIDADNPKHIRKNYVGVIEGGRIKALREKPRTITGTLMGTGTYLLQPELCRRLAACYESNAADAPRDWTSWLGSLCAVGADVRPFYLRGRYVNVNSRDDLNYANYIVRDLTFATKTVSLVYVLDHETDAALRTATAFADDPAITETVVATRRRIPALGALDGLPKVRVVVATTPTIETGELLRLGLDASRGDILIVGYSDDTFVARDVGKFLVYLRDADMVLGTRTTRQMIEQGTNMRGIVWLVHVLLAKFVELLWLRFECRFTDICCIYRAFWRSTYEPVRAHLTARGVDVFPELVIEALRARKRIIEIPVNYYNRDVGTERVYSRYQTVAMFLRIVRLVLRKRLEDLLPARWRRTLPGAATAAPALPGASEHVVAEQRRA
ncbi:MAG TPA: sugar phosphate nucleotidyltransferase [Candidatus Binatia bacterium]|nr:sugar phosphate nucleotidyltransferase [Candidatus Binatia bacterium]